MRDLDLIDKEAKRLGIPYQTLIGSILHRFVKGELVDRKSPDIEKLLKALTKKK